MRRLAFASLTTSLLVSSCGLFKVPGAGTTTYRNPLTITAPDGTRVETCADPSVIRSKVPGDPHWYLYCTTDPLNAQDKDGSGNLRFRLIPVSKSTDLVNWTYVGDAFAQKPGWVKDDAGLWAPEIVYQNGKYYLYYAASDTKAGGSAIGVATSDSPAGPWTDSGGPVVEPQAPPGGDPNARRWVFDPEVLTDQSGQRWIYYGSYFGGLSVRKLSADGLKTDPATQVEVALDNRYEGALVTYREGYYYLMASATNCCNGPLTGYSVFAGRSTSPTGPFVDREGVSLLSPRVGGTPVLSLNGNRWVGPGHHDVFTDAGGQDWTIYHAIDRYDPDLGPGLTKRPALLDPIDWVNGWPTVRGGSWASDEPMPGPAAQPGEKSAYRVKVRPDDQVGERLSEYGDAFAGDTLGPAWSWVRPPAGGFGVAGGVFTFDTQAADLYEDQNSASVLTRAAPSGDYAVQVKLRTTVPAEGCCQNYVQGGLLIYGDDDRYLKLAVVSIWNTRQIEWAKETPLGTPAVPRYGNTVLGPPGDTTWLRIVRRGGAGGEETYTAYSSLDGLTWVRGGTWTHALGRAKIGLVSQGGAGFQSEFSDLRVYRLRN
ncbi:Glycosyl hydrolases family 43 [Deinococcus reticulitermitis]|uniref:Glycosyl hydrolases family 43 n=1 Tax=Deinococcus reticulitermitis TaxID=856736 RepID=A0A1H6Y1D1_9DEIO|nr:family 43 glycosylhydrolase [Deinococcus reticulitermitis]SEJ32827.1 Glycosyl hydrolases family 43 [Deinococcus reticulitermitis]